MNAQPADYKTAALPLSYIGLADYICGAAHDSQLALLCATHTVMVDRQVSNPILLDISQLRYRYTSDP